MPDKAKPVPDGYNSVTPYLSLRGGSDAIAFYKRAFGAEEIYRMDMPGGKLGHAEIKIGDSRLMLADEFPEMPEAVCLSPETLKGSTVSLMIYLPNVDAAFQRAVDAGATVKRPVQDQFYGDRSGIVQDPFGHVWTLSTHMEDVAPEELAKRMAAMVPG